MEHDDLMLVFRLDGESAAAAASEQREEATYYGKSLSFDWEKMRFRMTASGDPVIVSGQESLFEDVVKALVTPRFLVPIYSDDYGSEFEHYIGTPYHVAASAVEPIIRDTLLVDSRVRDVVDFNIESQDPGVLVFSFSLIDFLGNRISLPSVSARYS